MSVFTFASRSRSRLLGIALLALLCSGCIHGSRNPLASYVSTPQLFRGGDSAGADAGYGGGLSSHCGGGSSGFS